MVKAVRGDSVRAFRNALLGMVGHIEEEMRTLMERARRRLGQATRSPGSRSVPQMASFLAEGSATKKYRAL